ncbi:DUF3078 domain-containing protein [bacterium SCSIO 12741]|nr:DUF3078 domain-containing protein [bacterium SCSIO 12741]
MKKRIYLNLLLAAALLIGPATSFAQADSSSAAPSDTSYWKKGGTFSLNIAQTSLVNWAAGGENSVAANGLFKVFANYKKGKYNWENDLLVGYGGILSGEDPWNKTDDRIEFNSKGGREAAKKWYYSAFINFRTQMFDGYALPNDSDLISTFMAPGYLTMGLGMDYKPDDHFSANISPVAGKITFVGNQDLANFGAFGVEAATYDTNGRIITEGENIRYEFGGNLSLRYVNTIAKNIDLDTKINFFSNYLDRPGNIDVNWDLLLKMKVNKWLSASLTTSLIYDHDIDIPIDTTGDGKEDSVGPRTQFKEVLGVGLSLSF